MLIRSLTWVRTWTGVLALAATWLACPPVGRAEQPGYAPLSPTMLKAFSALMEQPTPANLQSVRGLLAADRTYDPYSGDLTQISTLLHEGKHQEVIALVAKARPNLLLSPKVHRLASEAARGIGDQDMAAREKVYATRCVEGILATGEGSESHPFLVARVSDEADLLDAKFKTRIDSQALVFRDDQKFDRVIGKDGNTYWFDVSMPVGRLETMKTQAPVAVAVGGASVSATSAAAAPANQDLPAGVKALVQRGLEAYRAGQNATALSALSEAIELDPRDAGIHVDRGNVWYVQHEYELAIADFSEAILLDPGRATAYSNRGLAWSALEEHDKAIADFNAAIRLQANFGRAYNGRGCAFQAKGMLDTAIADFDEAIRLNPNYATAYENRSAAHAKLGNKKLADADAAKASELRGAKATPAAPAATAEKTAGN